MASDFNVSDLSFIIGSIPDITATGTIFNKTLDDYLDSKIPDHRQVQLSSHFHDDQESFMAPATNSSLELNKTLDESPSYEDKEFEKEHRAHEIKPLLAEEGNERTSKTYSTFEGTYVQFKIFYVVFISINIHLSDINGLRRKGEEGYCVVPWLRENDEKNY